MGRRARCTLPDDDVVAALPVRSARKRGKRDIDRQAPAAKQSRRQRAADTTTVQQFDTSLKRLLPTQARTASQAEHLRNLRDFRIVLATGPAGTGKTYCPIASAMDMLAAGDIEQIVCLRPTVECGNSLGFLPGKLADKLDPFFKPIRRSISKKLGNAAFAERWIESALEAGTLVFASIQHLRGDTLENCFVHLDEAQNATYVELKLVVTRMGEGSRFSICGDAEQTDLPDEQSGWREMVARLAPLTDAVAVTRYSESDVVRDPLLRRILPHL